MAATKSPSPSPPPEAPTSNAPGPRSTALHKIYTSALQHTLASNSYANFSSCFPTPAKYCPTALEGVWKQLNSRLQEECLKDFEKICIERNVTTALNEWDNAIEEARTRKARAVDGEEPPKALHTLSGDELHTAQISPFLIDSHKQLQTKLDESQKSNLEMAERVKNQRKEIEHLLNSLEYLVQDVCNAADVLEKDKQEIKSETKEIEQELTALRS